jgi:WD40-like Beta Propeller Repeat
VSNDGSIAFRVGMANTLLTRQFAWFDRNGRKLANVGAPFDGGQSPSMSPDGRRVAMFRRVASDWDIWLLDVERGIVSRFSFDAGDQVNPIWSPDGRRIVYLWRSTGASQLYQKAADAAGKEEPLLVTEQDKSPSDWSSDGQYVLYQNTDPKTGEDLWALPRGAIAGLSPSFKPTSMSRTGNSHPTAGGSRTTPTNRAAWRFTSNRFPDRAHRLRFPLPVDRKCDGGATGGSCSTFGLDNRLMVVPIRNASQEGKMDFGTPMALFPTGLGGVNFIVSRDGQRFLLNQVGEAPVPIAIILNRKAKPES